MRIMSLNGWGGHKFAELSQFLEAEAPDVLCLQEVNRSTSAAPEWLIYREDDHRLKLRANLFREVGQVLPRHVGIFCPALRGPLWHAEAGKEVLSEWGVATFVRQEYSIIAQMQGLVHGSYSPHGYGSHPQPRSAHVIRLFDFERGWSIIIAQMHGLRLAGGKADNPHRVKQAHRFVEMINSVAEPGDRIVACGDFNVVPESQTFDALAGLGLRDLVTGCGFTDTRSSHYHKPTRYADYMLINDLTVPRSFDVIADPEVSDHLPLLLEI